MISRLRNDATSADVVEALDELGVTVIENLLSHAEVEQVLADLSGSIDRTPISGDEFTGRRSQVVHTVVKRSQRYRELLLSELYQQIVESVLGDNCRTWRLSASALMSVHEGGHPQMMHRDEMAYEHFIDRSPSAPPYLLSMILALTDFTEENGATRFVPRSHRWELDREPRASEEVQATMSKGSVAVWLGSTLHGLGVNRTPITRRGIITISAVGWLRQEENFYGSVPQELALEYPLRLQQMLGWQEHSPGFGYVPGRDPNCQLMRRAS